MSKLPSLGGTLHRVSAGKGSPQRAKLLRSYCRSWRDVLWRCIWNTGSGVVESILIGGPWLPRGGLWTSERCARYEYETLERRWRMWYWMRQLGSSRVQQSRCLNCSNEAWLVSFKVKGVFVIRTIWWCLLLVLLMLLLLLLWTMIVVVDNGYCEWRVLWMRIFATDFL